MITNAFTRPTCPSLKWLAWHEGMSKDTFGAVALVSLQQDDSRAVLATPAAAELPNKASHVFHGISVNGSADHKAAELAEVDFDASRDLVLSMLRKAERVGDDPYSLAERYASHREAEVC